MAKVSLNILKYENLQGREKAFYYNIFCDEVFWTQYNILQTHKLMYDYLRSKCQNLLTDSAIQHGI